jgi:transcription elongation GreA/GreB family factor
VSIQERRRVLARIAQIRQMLRHTDSADVRATLLKALADCEDRLSELEAPARNAG